MLRTFIFLYILYLKNVIILDKVFFIEKYCVFFEFLYISLHLTLDIFVGV